MIFSYADTIEENVKFGREIPRGDLERAAEIAQAAEFINNFEDGWQHMLSQKGTNLSGGQRQRLLITRALAGNPKILLLDDSSSALDYKTDSNLRRAIARAGGGMTTIIVAQRVSSVMNSDMIIVLDEGRIIGAGRHEELMRDCEVYRNQQFADGGAFLNNPRFMMGGGGGGCSTVALAEQPTARREDRQKDKIPDSFAPGRYMLQHKWLVMLAAGLMVASNLWRS